MRASSATSRRGRALQTDQQITVAAIAQLLSDFDIAVGSRQERAGAYVWDLDLDGERRRALKVTLIFEDRPDGVLIAWAHLAPPLGDGLRKAYRQLLEWNERFLFVKFGIAEDGRPVLSFELDAATASRDALREGLARILLIADLLLDEMAPWIWKIGRAHV